MPIVKIVRDVGISRSTWGGSQNFLGAHWVEHIVDNSPTRIQERVALGFLSLSPHYFYDRNIRAEAERNRRSRRALADALVMPHVDGQACVLDYGCGPGYMASAVAERAGHVYAADISRGVLACARVLNGRPNITYLRPDELGRRPAVADLAYSFAVAQHLRTVGLADMLRLVAATLRPGGVLLLHFAVPGQGGWRTEGDWTADRSVIGRARLRYGLNCFGRSVGEMESLVSGNGFTEVVIRPLEGSVIVPGGDDVTRQHWLTARRR
jgi:SAM-dependent methyltransferase